MKIPPRFNKTTGCLLIFAGLSLGASSQAANIQLGQVYSDGAVPPGGSPPWLTVTTSNHSTGAVLLELEASNLIQHEFVTEWELNLDPALDPTKLVFSSPEQSGSFVLPTIQTGSDQFKADGDGWFDIQLLFSSANTNPDAFRFTAGDKLTYLVTLTGAAPGTFHESSLLFSSASGGGTGPFQSAAHIQGTGDNSAGSAWIANVPEPSSILLGGLGLLSLLRRRRG